MWGDLWLEEGNEVDRRGKGKCFKSQKTFGCYRRGVINAVKSVFAFLTRKSKLGRFPPPSSPPQNNLCTVAKSEKSGENPIFLKNCFRFSF